MGASVLFDGRLVLEKPTGIGRYITALVPELLRQAPDWSFHLLRRANPWPGYHLTELCAPNLTHHVTPLRHMSPAQHLYLPWKARTVGADLLHYPHFDAPVFWQPVPVVATLHDAKYLVHPDFFTGLSRMKQRLMRLAFGRTLQQATVITISQATARDLRQRYDPPSSRLHVIYEAADPSFRPSGADDVARVRGRYGLQKPFLLTVGERRPHKNHVGLIQAYAQSVHVDTHDLVIVGQPHGGYDRPEQLARELGLRRRIHFLTGVPPADLVALYTAAELFLLVSFYEGFGLPILEAMACGTPVIASRTTAVGEVTGPGGLQVDPADPAAISVAIDELLSNAERRHTLVARAAQWQQQFSWERTAVETLAVYRQVLA